MADTTISRLASPLKPILGCLLLASLWVVSTTAAEVNARLSTREAIVGVPIVLQISITNAQDYKPPTLPDVDGCDIRSAGEPSHRSQVTIINGRRSESSSDTFSYLITPRREGSFELPAFDIQADGRSFTVSDLRFVATKSETDDLLFVEIDGDKDKVYVGQPLNLTLKIWLKPFRDRQRRLTLSEGDMWQMISPHSSWGSFTERMQEMADSRRRPGGQEVLRTDSEGNERSYYLYEIDGTIYPTHAGSIDADEVQIVVDYPTSLGPTRSSLGGLFDDDFFGAAFGNRLAVASSKTIVGEVRMDRTEVLPVPTDGRPDDYRGAVGQYEIVTQANPITVDAGDPITLNIGIAGTGPMELVQAPPLHELPELTADFKVADESLAGFVKQDTKLFSTTIRPRREGITTIPPIRFSYFDPDAEQFKTVHSEPISITVDAAESLAMDSIVGRSRSNQDADAATSSPRSQADFSNHHDPAVVLVSQTAPNKTPWWWLLVVLPPLVWLTAVVSKHHAAILRWLPSLRSARAKCLSALQAAQDGPAMVAALRQYIAQRSRKPCPTNPTAIGVLRTLGMYDLAGDVESWMHRLDRDAITGTLLDSSPDQNAAAAEAIALVEQLEYAFAVRRRIRLRTPQRSGNRSTANPPAQRFMGCLVAAAIASSTSTGTAADAVSLSPQQRQTVLAEAAQAYTAATTAGPTDSADAKAGFEAAASKYQLLVDSGIHNSQLYRNLANAYLQSGQLGRAIAYYERAQYLAPYDSTIQDNLRLANSRIQATSDKPAVEELSAAERLLTSVRSGNAAVLEWLGRATMITVLGVASILFWGLLTIRTLGQPLPAWRWALLPLVLMLGTLCCGSLWLEQTAPPPPWNAVIVADRVDVYAGDGQAFDQLRTFDQAQGQRVLVVLKRGKWVQIHTPDQQRGWIPERDVVLVREYE